MDRKKDDDFESKTWVVDKEHELRLEVDGELDNGKIPQNGIGITLVHGTAEVFGTELNKVRSWALPVPLTCCPNVPGFFLVCPRKRSWAF